MKLKDCPRCGSDKVAVVYGLGMERFRKSKRVICMCCGLETDLFLTRRLAEKAWKDRKDLEYYIPRDANNDGKPVYEVVKRRYVLETLRKDRQ